MRTAWPSGSAPGNSSSTIARPTTMTCAPLTSSSLVIGAPALDADVADVEQRRLRAVDRRVLELAPAGDDVAPAAARSPRRATRSPATLSRKRTSLRVMVGLRAILSASSRRLRLPVAKRATTNESLPNARALASRADRARPSSPVCTTAVVATAAAMARPASDARSGLPRIVAMASDEPFDVDRRRSGASSSARGGRRSDERAVLQVAQRLVRTDDDRARLRRRRSPRCRVRRSRPSVTGVKRAWPSARTKHAGRSPAPAAPDGARRSAAAR